MTLAGAAGDFGQTTIDEKVKECRTGSEPIDFASHREKRIRESTPTKQGWHDHARLFDERYQDRPYKEFISAVEQAIPGDMARSRDAISGIAHYALRLKEHIQDLKRARSYWQMRDVGYDAATTEFFNNGIAKHLDEHPYLMFGSVKPERFISALKKTLDAYGRDCDGLKEIQASLERHGKERPDCLDALPAYMLKNPRGFVNKAYAMLHQ